MSNQIINPFLFVFKNQFYVLAYLPYKHSFFKFTLKEYNQLINFNLNKKKLEEYEKQKLIVEKDYKQKFIKHYQKFITEPKLNLMYLILTDNCNFNCPYCFIENNYLSNKRTSMSFELAKKAVDFFLENSKKEQQRKIIFYGGEPTLNEKVLINTINYIRSRDNTIEIGINSNGSKYNKNLSECFKNNNIVLSISLDSFPELNDKTRIDYQNKGQSELVEKNIKKYIKDGVFVSLSITLNGYNIDYLPAFAKYIIKNFPKIRSIGFNLSLENKQKNRLFVDPEYSAFQIYNAFRIFRKYGIYEDRVMRRLKHIIEENIYLKDCGACGNQIVVSPEGLIGPCHGFLGMKKDFQEFKGFDFYNNKIISKWNNLSPITNKHCISENCPFILICGNSCPYYSFITKHSLKAPDKRMCKYLPLLISELGKDLFITTPQTHIFIDYDGVIISRKPTLEILKEIKQLLKSDYEIKPQKYYNVREIVTNLVKNSTLKDKSESQINNYLYLYSKKFSQNSQINYPLLNQLKKLKKKYKLKYYVITNNSEKNIKKELAAEYLLFEGVIDKKTFSYKKGSKEFPSRILKKLKLIPEEVIYIGDSFQTDIKPFYNSGYRTTISFYANPRLYHQLDNGWLEDIIDDVFSMSLKNEKE